MINSFIFNRKPWEGVGSVSKDILNLLHKLYYSKYQEIEKEIKQMLGQVDAFISPCSTWSL